MTAFQSDQPFQFAHVVYFELADRSARAVQMFVQACVEYLSGHQGQHYFAISMRALEMHRDVNDQTFDIAMTIIFETKASYDLYSTSDRHEQFITVTAGMSTGRRVFDSYIRGQH